MFKFKNKTQITLLISCFIAFLLFSFLIFTVWLPKSTEIGQIIFSWPDATANYFFTEQLAENGQLTYAEPLNQVLSDEIIRMRSVNVLGENIVPMGFLGLPVIYGLLSKIIGLKLILFITPLLAILFTVFFYLILKRVFNEKIALLSSILTLLLPAFIYYSSLPFLNSILFLFLTISGIFSLIKAYEVKPIKRNKFIFLAGLLLSLAFFTRMVEVYWLFFIVLILFINYRHKIKFFNGFVLLVSSFLVLFLILTINQKLYGHWSYFGYLRFSKTGFIDKLPTEFQVSGINKFWQTISFIFLPFGWHWKLVLKNIYTYIIELIWPIFILGSAGLLLFIKKFKSRTKAQKTYFWIFIVVSSWLIFYYGNWAFIDPQVLNYNRISSSYARYWLPIYILMLPFVSFLIFKACKVIKFKVKSFFIASLILIALMGIFSYQKVYKNQYDGLIPLKNNLEIYYDRFEKIEKLTEENSIIITDRTDKIFFPKRKVVVLLDNFLVFEILKPIIKDIPIYYFSSRTEAHITIIKEKYLQDLNLNLNLVKKIDSNYELFKLIDL